MAFPQDIIGNDIRSVAYVVLDSLRWDSFERATKAIIDRRQLIVEKCYSYASWTQPSHSCILSGLFPHQSTPNQLASTIYKKNFNFWNKVLGERESGVAAFLPEFVLALMAKRNGWNTYGRVAMPVLNPSTAFSRGFDDYELSIPGSSLVAQIESLSLSLNPGKNFVFINAGETHYPYLMPKHQLPNLSGINGILNKLSDSDEENDGIPFSKSELKDLHYSQIKGFEKAQLQLEALIDLLEKPLLLIVTSDHGELFGEDNYFGHGPFFHPLLFEVPLAMGVIK